MINGIATLHRPSFRNGNGIIHQSTALNSNIVHLSRHGQLAMVELRIYLHLSLPSQ